MKLTKTQTKVLNKIVAAVKNGENKVFLMGVRECDAAKSIAERFNVCGKKMAYTNHSNWQGGDYYIDPFTRRAKITRKVVVIEGVLSW